MGGIFSKALKAQPKQQSNAIEPLVVTKNAFVETIKHFKLASFQAVIVSIVPIIPKIIAPFILKRLITDIRLLSAETYDESEQHDRLVYVAAEAIAYAILYNLNRTFKGQHNHLRKEFITRVGNQIIAATLNNVSNASLVSMGESHAGKLPSTINVLANETRELISYCANIMYSGIDLIASTLITPIEMGMVNRLILGGVLFSTFVIQFNSVAKQLKNELDLLSSSAHIDTELIERTKNHLVVLHYKTQRFEKEILDVLLEKNAQMRTSASSLQLNVATKRFWLNSIALAINLLHSISRYASREISDVSDIVLSYQQLDSNIGVSTDISASAIALYRSWSNLSKTVDRLNLAMTNPSTQLNRALVTPLPSKANEQIRFQDVSFGYRDSTFEHSEFREILRAVTFKIPRNKITVVVGPTGAGKSSIAKLIAGLYFHQSGVIKAPYPDLQSACTYIPCEPLLFANRSLFENILYSFSLSNEDAVPLQALNLMVYLVKKFNLLTLLKLNPEESDDKVIINALKFKKAVGLSTGEAKRIALIRGFINARDLLILDEPTNGLDTATSQNLMSYIMETMRSNNTLVIITHDLNLAKAFADHVLILAHKTVSEGTHSYLLGHHEGYQQLWRQQNACARTTNRYRFHQDEPLVSMTHEPSEAEVATPKYKSR